MINENIVYNYFFEKALEIIINVIYWINIKWTSHKLLLKILLLSRVYGTKYKKKDKIIRIYKYTKCYNHIKLSYIASMYLSSTESL